ncbi:MAG: MarR family transcriptional regulator [Crocinitomicaceae bacterium]|nr:MarR family transcriptional regulator [Crocinitomicaceae bacterium]
MISKMLCSDDSIAITRDQLMLVEKLGVLYEHSGMQPAAARVASLLVIADQTELTFDQIRATMRLSKSATSNAINTLLNTKRIIYITKPGDRKRYFTSDVREWKAGFLDKFGEMMHIVEVYNEVLKQRTKETPEFNKDLEEMISLMSFIFDEIPKLFKKWDNQNQI